jgi:integrase
MILATTALRISEVAGLQVGDVDLPHGLLTVRRQTYQRPGHQGDQGPAVASGADHRAAACDAGATDSLDRAGEKRPALRHTALTWMADAGVELHLLQRVAGHQDLAVTSRNLHPDHQAVLDVGVAYSR